MESHVQDRRSKRKNGPPCPGALAGALILAVSTSLLPAEQDTPTRPAWIHDSISGIEASRAPKLPSTPHNPARASLDALDGSHDPLPQTPDLPAGSRIATLPVSSSGDSTNVLEKLELVDAEYTIKQADQLVRARRMHDALQLLHASLEKMTLPRSRFLLHHRLGMYYFRKQEYDLAVDHMRTALELEPGHPTLASNLGAALMTRGNVDEAIEALSSIHLSLVQKPNLLFSVYFNLACAHSLSGHTDPAVTNLQQAARYDAEATLASIGDIQLDAIRDDVRVRELILNLEAGFRAPTIGATEP